MSEKFDFKDRGFIHMRKMETGVFGEDGARQQMGMILDIKIP